MSKLCNTPGCPARCYEGGLYCKACYEALEAKGKQPAFSTPPPTPANDHQPGGDHYRRHGATGEQHWDRMWRLVGPAWFIGNITKYAERATEKGGLEDLDKVIHYAQKYRELMAAWLDGTGAPPGVVDLSKLEARLRAKKGVVLRAPGIERYFEEGPADSTCAHEKTLSTCPWCTTPVNKESK